MIKTSSIDNKKIDFDHSPVMLNEVIEMLSPQDGGIYLDGTFGLGGYSREILDAADCKLLAIDRDIEAKSRGQLF